MEVIEFWTTQQQLFVKT